MTAGGLDGRIAFITGAGSGLGAAFARRLATDGALVVVNDLDPEAAEKVAAEVGGEAAPFDVTDSSALDAAVDAVVARHGRLDVMINNAGIAPAFEPERFERGMANAMLRMEGRIAEMEPLGSLRSITDADWDRMIRTHLNGTFFGTRAALRHMEPARSGSIINISSILGLLPSGGPAHYSAAKAAIIAVTKSVAQEVAHLGIRCNAICPGYIDTPLLKDIPPEAKAMVTMRIAMGRMGTAEELAEVVRFLAGDESSYCTGDVFAASGGYS